MTETVNTFGFQGRVEMGHSNATEIEDTIRKKFPGCVIERAILLDDKKGIDYWITLPGGGAKIRIDVKRREAGCSQNWFEGVEVTLESWSIMPSLTCPEPYPDCPEGVVGWTLDARKDTDYTLHVYHDIDTRDRPLLPFQQLRMAFEKHLSEWMGRYKTRIQKTTRGGRYWFSQCVYVPLKVVMAAIDEQMAGGA